MASSSGNRPQVNQERILPEFQGLSGEVVCFGAQHFIT